MDQNDAQRMITTVFVRMDKTSIWFNVNIVRAMGNDTILKTLRMTLFGRNAACSYAVGKKSAYAKSTMLTWLIKDAQFTINICRISMLIARDFKKEKARINGYCKFIMNIL